MVVLDRCDQRARSGSHRSRRRHVRGDAWQPGHRHRGENGHPPVAVPPSPRAIGHQPASDHPRCGPSGRQGVPGRERRRADGAGRPHWAHGVVDHGGRQPRRPLHEPRPARGRWQGAGRNVRGRARHSRVHRRVPSRHRQGAVEDLHGSGAWRTRKRNLAERWRSVEDRWRLGMGDRQLRSRDQPGVLGHRQRRAMDGRPAPRRQPLYRLDHRRGCGDGTDPGALPVHAERIVRLGRSVAADSGGLPAERPDGEGAHRRGPKRVPVVPRARQRTHQVHPGRAVCPPDGISRTRSGDRPARRRPGAQAWHRQDRGVLPLALGRQELAAHRFQSSDAPHLRAGQREPVRVHGGSPREGTCQGRPSPVAGP